MRPPEDWRLIRGYPDYWVSSHGRVVSLRRRRERELVGGRNQRGYRMVLLQSPDGGKAIQRTIHRLVAEAFIGPLPEGMQTRHLDGDKNNNAAWNLRYGTPSVNMHDQVRHGVHAMARKTHCPQGHPYSDENTYIVPCSGGRMCRTCMRARYSRAA